MDPYRLHNGLDEQYRPIGEVDGVARRPPFPHRLRAMIYGFALLAEAEARAAAGNQT